MACGVPAESILAELMGRETGVCRGRGGSAMFVPPTTASTARTRSSAPALRSPVARRWPRGEGRVQVSLTAFGDGAMNQGGVHEAMDFAAYLNLPVLFVCENNSYAELTPIADTVRDADLYKRAAAYGMPGVRIDGSDVAARASAWRTAQQARAGKGPALIEMTTQRLVGHYYGDMQGYRPRGEVAEARKREPIVRLREALQAAGVGAAELDGIEAAARGHVEAAATAALAAPPASIASVEEHLYALTKPDPSSACS